MKYSEWQENDALLSPEEQEILQRLNEHMDTETKDILLDIQLRGDMCATLADMGDAVRELLLLLGDSNLIAHLPEDAFPRYQNIMQRIGSTAHNAMNLVDRSQSFDRDTLFALMPEHTSAKQ